MLRPVCFAAFTLCVATLFAESWILNGGKGRKSEDGVLEITGDGSDRNAWLGEPFPLETGQGRLYRFSMEAMISSGAVGGCAPCGLDGFSRDRTDMTSDWKRFSFVFQPPRNRPTFRFCVGQWHASGTFRFRHIGLGPIAAIHRGIVHTTDDETFLLLGSGETLRNGVYRFSAPFESEGTNASRNLVETTCGFNSNRYTFGSEEEAVYGFVLKTFCSGNGETTDMLPFSSGSLVVGVNHHTRGECHVDVSPQPGKNWTNIGKIDCAGTIRASIPESFLPSRNLFVRIRSGKGSNFQVNRIVFEAAVPENSGFEGYGDTLYADVSEPTEKAATGYFSRPLYVDEQGNLHILHRNDSEVAVKPIDVRNVDLPPKSIYVETRPLEPGTERKYVFLPDKTLSYVIPEHPYRDAVFGNRVVLEGDMSVDARDDKTYPGLWWARSDWKIAPNKPPRKPSMVPSATGDSTMPPKNIVIAAAKNDYESFQLVVSGEEKGRSDVMLSVDEDLQGPGGATIPSSNVELRYVYYHFVHRPTDDAGLRGEWPDALPLLEKPLEIGRKRNQPFWVTVYVPRDAKAGDYKGRVKIHFRENGRDLEKAIPFALKVWNFALPRRNTLQTAFGLRVHRSVFRYHNCKTDADRRAVFDLYMQNFAKHRISPYDPIPLDPIKVEWKPGTVSSGAEVDFSDFDRAMQRAIEEYRITGYRMTIQGMGSGYSQGRRAGTIGDHAEGTPRYDSMFADYVRKLEEHLKGKGWLDMIYVYWFDEPKPDDYEFVAKGFAKLQKHAPGLPRMITEEPNPAFLEAMKKEGGTIDIWCPISHRYEEESAKPRKEAGERFWWYLCTSPKTPYCTIFIDHPGTEPRVWLWQTWQRGIVGTLVWDSVYWTSPSAFPDSFQNPYEDPMSYIAGGPKDSKRYWGNGDGRFLYPPLEAAVPGLNDGKLILNPPVSSIRWEMIREGVEDYEMLAMLRNLKEKHPDAAERIEALLTVPHEITSSMTEFTIDPEPIYEHREKIAEMIEKLSTTPIR